MVLLPFLCLVSFVRVCFPSLWSRCSVNHEFFVQLLSSLKCGVCDHERCSKWCSKLKHLCVSMDLVNASDTLDNAKSILSITLTLHVHSCRYPSKSSLDVPVRSKHRFTLHDLFSMLCVWGGVWARSKK